MKLRLAATVFAVYVLLPDMAHAYVDPGLVSMVVQSMFAAVAGFAAVYIVGPWRWIKSLFRKQHAEDERELKATSDRTE